MKEWSHFEKTVASAVMPFSLRHNINLLKVFAGFPAPIYVQLTLSISCTMRCPMCNIVQPKGQGHELDVRQIGRIADVLKRMGVGLVVLTGGEPLLYKDVVAVVAALCRAGITVRIQSNGLLAEPILLRRLRDAGLDGMTISLHSLSPTTMDKLTGVPGCLEKVFRALCNYSEVFPSGKYVGGINTVVTRANVEEIPRLIRFASGLGLTIALIPVHFPVCDGSGLRNGDSQLSFGRADAPVLHRIFAEARSLKRQGHRVYNTDRFLRECVDFLTHGKVSWKCLSPSLYFSVSALGTLVPCVDLGGKHSLLDQGFLESWRSGAIPREIRAQVSACPGCMYPCYPELSYLFYSKRMFVGRVLDYVKISASAPPLTMGRIDRVMEQLGKGLVQK